jgi:hypothetical protein
VRSELRRQYLVARCRFAAAFAATALVAMGLSLGAFQATASAWQERESPPSIALVASRLQQLSPGLSRKQSLRLAALRQMGSKANGQLPSGSDVERAIYDP